MCWPNFETFYKCFKDHPSFGPGKVDESCVVPIPKEEVVITDDLPEDVVKSANSSLQDTPSTSRCPSRLSNKSEQDDMSYVGDEDDDAEEDDDNTPPPKKVKSEKDKLPARVGKKRQQHHLALFSFCQHLVTSKN